MSGADRLFDAITEVRGDYIDAAGDFRFVRRSLPAAWRRYAALAACLALILSGALALSRMRMGSSGGNAGSTGGADSGYDIGGTDGSGWNGAALPEDREPSGDTAPPPMGPAGEGDTPDGEYGEYPPCWDCADGAVPALTLKTEGVTVAREVTLEFYEGSPTWVKDRYILTAGVSGGTVTVRYDGPSFPHWSGDAAEQEDGTYALDAGGTAEVVLCTEVKTAYGVLSLAEPEGVTPTDTTVIVAGRQWMEARGITVTLGDTVLDP